MSSRVKLFEQMLDIFGMIDQKSKLAMKKVMAVISNFTNPWEIDNKGKIHCLVLGCSVSECIEMDILRADKLGKTLKITFILE